jgi:hypothetical protein
VTGSKTGGHTTVDLSVLLVGLALASWTVEAVSKARATGFHLIMVKACKRVIKKLSSDKRGRRIMEDTDEKYTCS